MKTKWLAAGACLVCSAWMVGAAGQSDSGGARSIVEMLDRFVQPRFEKLDGRFGASRVARLNSHAAVVLYGESDREKTLLNQINGAGHSYGVDLLHIPHPVGRAPEAVGNRVHGIASKEDTWLVPISTKGAAFHLDASDLGKRDAPKAMETWKKREAAYTQAMKAHRDSLTSLTKKHAAELKKGKSIVRTMGDWLVAFRPVKASKAECVNCHTGSKLGDTLGVMVYAVKEQKDPLRQVAAK